MFDILRIQIPIYLQYITRVSFLMYLTENTCESMKVCKSNQSLPSQPESIKLHWYKYSDLKNLLKNKNLLGPEPILLFKKLKEENICLECKEVTIMDALGLIYSAKKQNNADKQLLDKVGYGEDDLISLYTDFLQHTYPSETMTIYSLKTFLTRLKLKLTDQAFQSIETSNYYLTFNQLIINLAKIDKLILSINNNKKGSLDMPECSEQFKDILPPMSPITHIRLHKQCYPPIQPKQVPLADVPKNALLKKLQNIKELCANCRSKSYTLSVHLVKMSIEGIVCEPMVKL